MKYLFIILLACSCATQKTLHKSGSYTIKTISRDSTKAVVPTIVSFNEVAGVYEISACDTLKKGDVIYMNVVKLVTKPKQK
jgi:hypothetical protein